MSEIVDDVEGIASISAWCSLQAHKEETEPHQRIQRWQEHTNAMIDSMSL